MADARPTYIYALMEDDLVTVRYVGKTVDLRSRYLSHLYPNKNKRSTHKANWVTSLQRAGKKPIMVELECVPPGEDWAERERYWISYYRALGFDLTNHSDGGEGPAGAVRSPETRRKISEAQRRRTDLPEIARRNGKANKGRKHTDEARSRMSESRRGRKPSPEAVEKTASAHRGRKRSPETCARISEALKGRKATDEQKRQMSERRKGKKRSAESVEKTAAAHRGRKRSDETREKLRQAWERRRQRQQLASNDSAAS